MDFDLSGFDLIWASPPCQAFTKAQKIQGNEHPELVEMTRARLKASGALFVLENVEGAPLENPVMLCGAMFPGLKTYRHRLFESNFKIQVPDHPTHEVKLNKMGRPPKANEFMHVVGNFSGAEQGRQAMGIHWMGREQLREAIPPIYSEFIAWQAREIILKQKEIK